MISPSDPRHGDGEFMRQATVIRRLGLVLLVTAPIGCSMMIAAEAYFAAVTMALSPFIATLVRIYLRWQHPTRHARDIAVVRAQ
jgi:hypothetical protein